MTRKAPVAHDPAAEREVVSAMFFTSSQVTDTLVADDFYVPQSRALFTALKELDEKGTPPDLFSLRDQLEIAGQSSIDIAACLDPNVGAYSISAAVDIVVRRSLARKLQGVLARTGDLADPDVDPVGVLDLLRSELGQIDGALSIDVDVPTIDEFLARPPSSAAQWVIRGILRRDWRGVIVAPEGVGKTLLLSQIALMAAHGLHPFTYEQIDPQDALVVDLENPETSVRERFSWLLRVAKQQGLTSSAPIHLFREPAGIDIRTRVGRSVLERAIRKAKPSLVCLGPLYKAYRQNSKESYEEATAEAQNVFDDLRTKYSFALLMEDHAPQSDEKGFRNMRPRGSVRWLMWPEVGIKLTPHKDTDKENPTVFNVGKYRGHRVRSETMWPARLEQSSPWPWAGVWDDDRWKLQPLEPF